jgi:hypothetical protein
MGERRVAYRFLMGKSEGKRLFGTPKRRWENSIRLDHKISLGLGWSGSG